MSVTIDGFALNDSVQWIDRYEWSPVLQSATRTLGGKIVISTTGMLAGRPITLQATDRTGWFNKAMVDDLTTKAASAGASYTLNFHGEVFTVVFAHHEPPAVSFTPILFKEPQTASDWFTGTVKLLTV